MGQRVKNRPTLVTTQPVVQLAWLGLGGKKAPRCKRGGDEDAKVTCEGGREESASARERGGETAREIERESLFSFGVQYQFYNSDAHAVHNQHCSLL